MSIHESHKCNNKSRCIRGSVFFFRSQVCNSSLSNVIRNSRSDCRDNSSSSSYRPFKKCNGSSNSRYSNNSSSSSALLFSCDLCKSILSHVSGNASSASTVDHSVGSTYAAARAPVAACAAPTAAGSVSAAAGAAASHHGEGFAAAASRCRLVGLARAAHYCSSHSIYTEDFCFFSCAHQEEDVGRRGLYVILLAVCCAVVEKHKDDACSLTSSTHRHSHVGDHERRKIQESTATTSADFSTTAAVADPSDAWPQERMGCRCGPLQRAAAAVAQRSNRRQQQQELRYATPLRGLFDRSHVRGSHLVKIKKKTTAGERILLLEKRIVHEDRNETGPQKFTLLGPRCCTAAACAAGVEQPEAKRWRPLQQKSFLVLLQQQEEEEKMLQHHQEQRRQELNQRQHQQQQPRQHQRPQRPSWERQQKHVVLPQQQQQHRTEEQTEADDSAPKRPQHALESAESVIRVMQQIAPCVVRIYRVSLGRRTAHQLLQSTAASHCCNTGSRDFSSSSHTQTDSSSSSTTGAGGSTASSLCAPPPFILAASGSSPIPCNNSTSSHSNNGNSILAAWCSSSSCIVSNGNGSSGSGLAHTERGRCFTASTRSNGISSSLAAHSSGNSSPGITASSNTQHQSDSIVSNLGSSTHSEGRKAAAGAVAQYLGSGFIYSPRGLVVTAAHLFVEQQQQHPDTELAEAAANTAYACTSSPITSEAGTSAGPATAASGAAGAAGDTTVADIGTGPLAVAAVPSSSSSAAAAAAACTVTTPTGVAQTADARPGVAAAAPPAAGAEAASWSYVVELADGRLLHATLKGKSSAADVAVLQLGLAPGEQLPAVSLPSFSNQQQLRPPQGEVVIAYGAPQHADEPVGVVGRVSQSMQRFSCLQVSSPLVPFLQLGVLTLPGMSGSPVCNLQGQVVGMLAKKFHECGLALPIHFVANVASQLATTGVYRPPFLGLLLLSEEDKCTAVADFAAEAQRQLQQPAGSDNSSSCTSRRWNSLVVDSVIEGSAAAAAGLQHGDVLTAIDGRPIGCLSELLDHLTAKQLGSVVGLRVLRGRDFFNCTVPLGTREL